MLLYSVLESIDYEGSSLLGVFASRDEAVAYIQSYDGYVRQFPGYSYGVVESALGQPVNQSAEFDFVEFV
jgi:hypothetical protein